MEGPSEAKKIRIVEEKKIEANHEGIRYPCDLCEYTCSNKINLRDTRKLRIRGLDIPVINVNIVRQPWVI